MKIPRAISGDELAKLLEKVGYRITRQTGSHVRLVRAIHGEHHLTIPRHKHLKIGTLHGILVDIALSLNIPKAELARIIWENKAS